MGLTHPRVCLLSNGEEPTKGNRLVRLAHQMLRSSTDLNFIGNIESKDIWKGTADVVVADGFTGSAVLATMRGLSKMILRSTQSNMADSGSEAINPDRFSITSRLRTDLEFGDSSTFEILGLQGHVLLAHPSGHSAAISSAIRLAWRHYAVSSLSSSVYSCHPV
jgi:glycerol-3-phosphate acyltransferase PlsX